MCVCSSVWFHFRFHFHVFCSVLFCFVLFVLNNYSKYSVPDNIRVVVQGLNGIGKDRGFGLWGKRNLKEGEKGRIRPEKEMLVCFDLMLLLWILIAS